MKQLITVNLTTKTTDWQPPVLTFGESLTLALRFEKSVNGTLVEPNLTINSVKASIGLVDARPGGGQFALQFGPDPGTSDNTTGPLQHDCTPSALASAINAKPAIVAAYGTATAKKLDGSWLLRFGTGGAEVPFKVVENSLWPVSFGRISARQLDNAWVHELRLVQAPVAFTSSHDIVLPPQPTITQKQAGGSSGSITWNEIQKLYIPADFRGAYRIKKGFQRTPLIAPDAGTDEIQAALNAGIGDGFSVTLPLSYNFLIEFIDNFGGLPFDPLEVEVEEAPSGDLTITLPLDRLELASLLRAEPSPELPLEIRIVAEEDGDGMPREIVALFLPVTVQRPLAFPELEETPTIDWLRFPSPKSYVPFGNDNVLTGEKIYAQTIGDGSHTSFIISHGLASEDVQVFARVNSSGGRQLVDGTDFSATIDGPGAVTITALTGTPATDAWRAYVVAAKEIASFAGDLTVTIAQVIGLEAELAELDGRISNLEDLLPANASLPNGVAPVNGFTIQLPQTSEILFARDGSGAAITDPTKLPARAPFMLPAINTTATPGALPTTPLPAPAAGALYTTATPTLIPGGGHIRSSMSVEGGFVGSDGRMNYPVTRSGTKDSYFPTPFERTLFEMTINDRMFSSGTTLTLLFKVALQLIGADTEAQWLLAIEKGAIIDETDGSPSTFDSNLLSIDWDTSSPLVSQRLILSSALETHGFGCTIANSAGTLTANGLYYKRIIAANDAAPPSANFALRARLFNFDTKNSVPNARGWVSWALQNPDSGTLGAVIA